MSYPTSPYGEATPADPSAIDLEATKKHVWDVADVEIASNLITAVEALRERLAALGEDSARRIRRTETAEARVVELEGHLQAALRRTVLAELAHIL